MPKTPKTPPTRATPPLDPTHDAQTAASPRAAACKVVTKPARRLPGRQDRKAQASRARTIAAPDLTETELLALPSTALATLNPKQLQTRTVLGQVRFLREYALSGNILRSAQAANVGRRVIYSWKLDPAFATLMAEAHEDALDLLEEEARRRGADGVLEPVFQGGKEVGSIRRYSDHLLMMFLKGKRRADFSERVEQTGANGSALAPAVVMVSWHASMKPPEQP